MSTEARLAGEVSVEQRAIALLDDIHGHRSARVILLDLRGNLEPTDLERAWRSLLARHDALRISFVESEGRLYGRRHPRAAADTIRLEVVEAGADPPRERALKRLAEAPLRITDWPVCRALVIRSTPERHLVALAFHPIVFDEHAIDIAVRDLLELYAAVGTGKQPALPSVPEDAGEFVVVERRAIEQRAAEAQTYWQPALERIADSARIHPPSTTDREHGRHAVDFRIDRDVRARLEQVGTEEQTSLFVVLVAAVQAWQHLHNGSSADGVTTALTVDARPRSFRDAIGMFSSELPLVSYPRDTTRFREFASLVDAAATELLSHRRFPFPEVLARFGGSSGSSEVAGQVGVSYRRSPPPAAPPGIEILSRDVAPRAGSPRPLIVALADEPDGLLVTVDFDAEQFASRMAYRMAEHLRRLLGSIADGPDAPIGALEMLSQQEREQIVADWGRGRAAKPEGLLDSTVGAMVEQQVARSPDAPAVAFRSDTLSYSELNSQANRLARRLRRVGVTRDVRVGVCLERSPDLIIGMLAILKAGGAYVPLDPSYPPARLQAMVDQARPRALLTRAGVSAGFLRSGGSVVLVDGDAPEISREADADLEPVAEPDDLAYVIFTSGSTGQPKGVAMPHRALCNLLRWQRSAFQRPGPRRTMQFASPSFDVAFQEIFGTLVTGGELVIPEDELRRDFDQLASFIVEHAIERLFLPPIVLREVARRLSNTPSESPVEVITAGERLEITPAIRDLLRSHPRWTVENQYGPTESHVVTSHRLGADVDGLPEHPPIGRPISGSRVYLLNGSRALVPAGVPGELYIGGRALARGYLGQPKLTAERFVQDPIAGRDARMYRTGDLARWGEGGAIEFLGRIDDQVKIRGFRIEPGEVAGALLRHPAIDEAAVVAEEQPAHQTRLAAYVVPRAGQGVKSVELREFLGLTLPDYMVPAAFVVLDSLPLTPNGKLDRRALPSPELSEVDDSDGAPTNETEARVAEIWAEVLGFERIGIDDDFFSLGGHSLLAADVVSRCGRALGVSLPVRALFSGPTPRQLAAAVEHARQHGSSETRIPRAPRRVMSELIGESVDPAS